MQINKSSFLQEIKTHRIVKDRLIFPDKNSATAKAKHDFITIYFKMKDNNVIALSKLRYKKSKGLTVATWKTYLSRPDKIPKAIDLFLAGYNEKYETDFQLKSIFVVKFS